MIGMWLGIHAPERLNKLVLCNTGARIGTRETWDTRIETVRKNGMKSVASAVVERWFTPAFRQKSPATISSTLKMIESANPDGYAACCAAIRDFDCREQLGKIRTPTLVISGARSEEHTSELQSRLHLVCRLLLEKKKRTGRKRLVEAMTSHDARQYTIDIQRPVHH